MNTDYLKLILEGIKERKMRSWLTMLGIFIGIAAVVALVSLSGGLEQVVQEQFNTLGTDKIFVFPIGFVAPGSDTGLSPLTKKDLEVLRREPGVLRGAGMVIANSKIEYKGNVRFLQVYGMPTDSESQKLFKSISSFKVIEGRNLFKQDKYKADVGVAFIEDNYFPENLRIRDKLTIDGTDYRIVGHYKRQGNPSDDRAIVIPEDTLRQQFNITDRYDQIILQTAPGTDTNALVPKIKKSLRRERGLKEGEEDFSIQTAEDLIAQVQLILNLVQVVLVGIAAISLIVGGIGIANTMYTAVLERTNDIGIMKAIGARNKDILHLFVVEAGILGLMGGIIGVLLGIGIAKGGEYLALAYFKTNLLRAYFPWTLIVGVLVFAFLIGVISGFIPAYIASRKSPLEALRYE